MTALVARKNVIEPYKTTFKELAPLLERLGFSKERDDTYGASYIRGNSYRLTISIERFPIDQHSGNLFASELEKIDGGPVRILSPECLMEAIEPPKAVAASEAIHRNGFSDEGISLWWRILLTFLLDHENTIFSLPSPGPHWGAYVRAYNQKVRILRESGITCAEIEEKGTWSEMAWPKINSPD